jgi:hypothetical protein
MIFFEKTSMVSHTVKLGTDVNVIEGAASTRENPSGTDNINWFAEPGTVILGSDNATEKTVVSWALPLPTRVKPSAILAVVVVVACKSEFGGLHVNQKHGPGRADLFLNGTPLQVMGLKTVPAGHDDFFILGLRTSRPDIQSMKGIGACRTVYIWEPSVEAVRLKADEPQVFKIVLTPKVRWDIDYVGLATTTMRRRLSTAGRRAGTFAGLVLAAVAAGLVLLLVHR